MGNPVWSYEWVQGGGRLSTATPWYTQPSQRLVWDAQWYVTGVAGWARADDIGNGVSQDYTPLVTQAAMTQNLSPALPISSPDQEPIVRWLNPASYTLDLSVAGTLRVEWTGEGTGYPVNVDLVLAQESAGGSFSILFATTVSKPHNDSTPETLDVPLNSSAVVSAGDSLLLSLRADGQNLHNWVILDDALTITIIPEPSGFALLAVGAGALLGVRRWRRPALTRTPADPSESGRKG
jgi:hypothetical protein